MSVFMKPLNKFRGLLVLLWLLVAGVTTLSGQTVVDITKPWTTVVGKATRDANVFHLESSTELVFKLKLTPLSRYEFSADLRTASGAEEVAMMVRKGKTTIGSIASALVAWSGRTIVFQTDSLGQEYTLVLFKPFSAEGNGAWVRDLQLKKIGDAVREQRGGLNPPIQRMPIQASGIMQQSNEQMSWMLDAKLGLFVHWGIYAGPAKGEWYMRNAAVPIDEYRKFAFPQSGDQQFLAGKFDAAAWAQLAKDAGCRYACLTAQHHDGYALFHSRFPDAFTSYNTHNRDFVREYTTAFRDAGLRVGLYKTLINWRYPGYYDVTGKDCQPNKWGYASAEWHKESARTMKEELYCMTKELLSNYGKIDMLFWDGGWLAESGSDADGAYFWEPSKYLSAQNQWPVSLKYTLTDSLSGQPLGLMGMVRQLQPDIVCNIRSGWFGDYDNDEGGSEISGPIRNDKVIEKCMSLHYAWGYTPIAEQPEKMVSLQRIQKMLADCIIRNMVLLVNVGPDRHGRIPDAEAALLQKLGRWIDPISDAIYGTRGGPWNPSDNQFGFSYKDDKIFVWLLKQDSDTFTLPSVGGQHCVNAVWDERTGRKLSFKKQKDGTYKISGIEKSDDVATVITVQLNKNVY